MFHKSGLILLAFLAFSFILPSKVLANLYINEFSSNSSPEWVEIYNSDSSSVDLSNYVIRDATSIDSHKIDLSGSISANGFASFDWGGASILNNDGDKIRLLVKTEGGGESSVNEVIYGVPGDVIAPQSGQTAGRSPDGTSNWVILATSSKNSTNNSSATLPTPTITPTNAPTPSKTPTPTKTSTPAPTSAPAKTPTPTEKLNSTPTPTPDDSTLKLASDTNSDPFNKDSTPTPQDTPEAEVLGATMSSFPWVFISLGLILIAVCGILAYFQFGSKIFIWKKKNF